MYNNEFYEKNYIRVFFADERGNSIFINEFCKVNKNEEDLKKELFIQEDLNYKEDVAKINLYNTCEYISLLDKDFKVIKRVFSPGRPSMLTLYLEEA